MGLSLVSLFALVASIIFALTVHAVKKMPAPVTFAEGQRAIYGWAIAAAGIFCGAAFVAVILLLWLGGWDKASESQRIAAIALLGAGFPTGMLSVIAALAVGGPVGKIKVSKDQIEAEANDTPLGPTLANS
jgi:hypothetical protein